MRHVLEQPVEAALAAFLRRRPLLGFDFDGTLAPIVPRPEQARVSKSVSSKLRQLSARLPVAIGSTKWFATTRMPGAVLTHVKPSGSMRVAFQNAGGNFGWLIFTRLPTRNSPASSRFT